MSTVAFFEYFRIFSDIFVEAVAETVDLDRPKIDEFPVLRTTGGGRPYKALCNLSIDAFMLLK